MLGNRNHHFTNTALLSVCAVDAPVVVTSASIDERLADMYARVRLRPGLLENMVGIRERRWWDGNGTFVDGAVAAGAKALSECGVDPADVGLMVNTSISRTYLEPATASAIHSGLGLPTSCQNFDLTNACLGFVNGMELGATMIDAGIMDYAVVVAGEDSRPVQERTLARLADATAAADVLQEFAALTLGSGAVAAVLGRADRHPEGHRLVASVSRAATEHHELCIGDNEVMRTDLQGLLKSGVQLSEDLWSEAGESFDWHSGMDRYVIHQVSLVHTTTICERLDLDRERVPLSFPARGNIGPASVPFTLAGEVAGLEAGERVLCMGIGSGLNAMVLEIVW